jgi:hypothetical protein
LSPKRSVRILNRQRWTVNKVTDEKDIFLWADGKIQGSYPRPTTEDLLGVHFLQKTVSSSVSPCDPHLASPRGSGALCATYVANTSISSMLLSRNNSKTKQQSYVRSHVSFSWGKLEKFDEIKPWDRP